MGNELSLDDLLPGPRPDDLRGRVVSGCRIGERVGQGGMGAVYAARRLEDDLPVAVKFLATREPALVARFQREWEALRKLGPSPHVVRVHAVSNADPGPHIVMEWVEGASLHDVLARRERLEPSEALELARGIAAGLGAVHALGLVHRDLKPGNVMLTPHDGVKLVDFGLAKDTFRTSLTKTGQLLGTAAYMAPEQWETGRPVDPRADLFALGALLYHLLLGRPPFTGIDLFEIGERTLAGDYPAPSSLDPNLPAGLEAFIAQLLMLDPAQRHPDARACRRDLDALLAGRPPAIPCLVLEASPARRRYLVPGRRFLLGSDPASALVLEGAGVAPRHAELRRKRQGFRLHDLRSSAGTRLNGERITGAVRLRSGDRIALGERVLRFEDAEGSPT